MAMKNSIVTAAILLIFGAGTVSAETVTRRLGVIANASGSIELTIQSIGGTPSGLGTATVTTAMGTISKTGPVPTGFTRQIQATKFILTTPVGIRVTKSNLTSANYTLTAALTANPASGVLWLLNNLLLSANTTSTITTTGTYGVTQSHTLRVDINDSTVPQSLNRTVTLSVVSN
ncbi:MAG TPA: hypothetical protein VEK79_02235, partial [Thermoanaerobaculia bacterium]|nr:hypothetical protein [Thermoanaerobaculia bacterium]